MAFLAIRDYNSSFNWALEGWILKDFSESKANILHLLLEIKQARVAAKSKGHGVIHLVFKQNFSRD